ncbi:MAG: hypothetical protein HFG67_04985 [Firmicutes bacterium]|nr:hypothetical protein [Bacillota bacterium]
MYDKKKLFMGILFLFLAAAALFGIMHNGVKSYYITILVGCGILGISSVIHSKTNR